MAFPNQFEDFKPDRGQLYTAFPTELIRCLDGLVTAYVMIMAGGAVSMETDTGVKFIKQPAFKNCYVIV